MRKILLPILMVFLMLLAIPIALAEQPTSPPGQADRIFLPHSTLIINNGTTYNITEYITNLYQNVTYLNETVIYNIDNRTLTTVVNNVTNVYPEYTYQTFNRYYITNYNVDLSPVFQQIEELRIQIKDIDADLDRDEGIIALLAMGFLALCGGVIYHVYYSKYPKASKPHRRFVYQELVAKDTDGETRYYKVVEEDEN